AGEFDNNRTNSFTLDFFSTTDWTDWTDTGPVRAIRQKHNKPLAVDADVSYEPLMMCPSVNPSSKLGYFQAATPSPLSGLCIYRKAINKDKPLVQRSALIMHVRRC
ncbi:MAG: hypothetical protein PUC48_06600, partial [Paraprevotella sp.]|nr:hypothetical protein [Paraprevotella sp.]